METPALLRELEALPYDELAVLLTALAATGNLHADVVAALEHVPQHVNAADGTPRAWTV